MKKNSITVDKLMTQNYPFIVVQFKEEDFSGYKAFLIDIPAIESIGLTPEDALKDLSDVKREWFSYALEKGIHIPEPDASIHTTLTYSGRITLRLSKSLHRQVAEKASLDGVSLNAYLNEVIQRGMSASATT